MRVIYRKIDSAIFAAYLSYRKVNKSWGILILKSDCHLPKKLI